MRAAADRRECGVHTMPPLNHAPANWEAVLKALRNPRFEEETLPAHLQQARWFGGKAHPLRRVRMVQSIPLGPAITGRDAGRLAFLEADYSDIAPEVYLLPLQLAAPDDLQSAASIDPQAIVARLNTADGECVVFDAVADDNFRCALFEIILREKLERGSEGELVGVLGEALKAQVAELKLPLPSRALRAEQSNSAIIYDERFFLKLYRKPALGENPDAELLRFLSERQKFKHVPAFCGAIEFREAESESRVLAVLVENVANEGDAWKSTLEVLREFFARVPTLQTDPARIDELIGSEFSERARRLGLRTAQMHLALAADPNDPNFAPEPFTESYQRSLHDAMRGGVRRMKQLLEQKLENLPEKYRAAAAALLQRDEEIAQRQAALLERKVMATRTRHHGDYHLGQVLNTGDDFIIIDFEGEPARSLDERRAKASPLRDVAGMLRSFHYAAHMAVAHETSVGREDRGDLESWAELWSQRIAQIFLDAYLETARGASFIPEDSAMLGVLLDLYLIEKAAYEICYELNNRPDWLFIPLRGITRILEGSGSA